VLAGAAAVESSERDRVREERGVAGEAGAAAGEGEGGGG
jgi:hypothetical protein